MIRSYRIKSVRDPIYVMQVDNPLVRLNVYPFLYKTIQLAYGSSYINVFTYIYAHLIIMIDSIHFVFTIAAYRAIPN